MGGKPNCPDKDFVYVLVAQPLKRSVVFGARRGITAAHVTHNRAPPMYSSSLTQINITCYCVLPQTRSFDLVNIKTKYTGRKAKYSMLPGPGHLDPSIRVFVKVELATSGQSTGGAAKVGGPPLHPWPRDLSGHVYIGYPSPHRTAVPTSQDMELCI